MLFFSVFVHRYRDLDAAVRADCVHALGDWMRARPQKYVKSTYFRYVGWLLSDQVSDLGGDTTVGGCSL